MSTCSASQGKIHQLDWNSCVTLAMFTQEIFPQTHTFAFIKDLILDKIVWLNKDLQRLHFTTCSEYDENIEPSNFFLTGEKGWSCCCCSYLSREVDTECWKTKPRQISSHEVWECKMSAESLFLSGNCSQLTSYCVSYVVSSRRTEATLVCIFASLCQNPFIISLCFISLSV